MAESRKLQLDVPIAAAGFLAGLAMSVGLSGASQGLGVVTTAASLGYGIRSAQSRQQVWDSIEQARRAADLEVEKSRIALERKELKIEELKQELADAIEEFSRNKAGKGDKDKAIDSLNDAVEQFQRDIATHKAAYLALYEQLGQAKEDAEAEIAKLKADHQRQLQLINQKIGATISREVQTRLSAEKKSVHEKYKQRINEYVQRQIDRQRALKEQLEQTKEEAGAIVLHKHSLAERFKDECHMVLNALNGWIAETEVWHQQAAEQFQMALYNQEMQYQQELERVYAQISEFLKPQRLNSLDPASLTANQVADWFLREHNILIDVVKAKPYTDRHEIWCKPRMGGKKQLEDLTEALWLEFELADKPEFEVSEGAIKITLVPAETLDDSVTFSAKAGKDEVADEVEASDGTKFRIYNLEDRLRHWIRNTERYHLFVTGDSGSGKDTFFSNIADLLEQELNPEGLPDTISYEVIDAKDPNDTPLKIRGEVLRPKYRGINYPNMDEKYWTDCDVSKGFAALQDEVGYRMVIGRQAADEGKPIPKFQPRIWFISELEESISVLGTSPRDCVLSAARLGRSLAEAVIVNGQSGQVSSYKMITSNLRNFACVFLRENAIMGAQQLCPTAVERKPLLRGISYLQSQAEGTDRYDPRRFWGLVKLPGEPPFLAYMPRPNAFSKVSRIKASEENLAEETENAEDTPIAPLAVVSGAQELMQMIEDRQRELAGMGEVIDVSAEPEPEPDEAEPRKSNLDLVLERLSIPAQCVFNRYLEKELIGQSITVRWVQRTGITNADMRKDMKKPKVIETFQELAGAGLGVYDAETEKWCYLGLFEEGREHGAISDRKALQQTMQQEETAVARD